MELGHLGQHAKPSTYDPVEDPQWEPLCPGYSLANCIAEKFFACVQAKRQMQ